MRVTLNGEEQVVADGARLAQLLEQFEIRGRVAIEVNAEIIRRSDHDRHELRDGDRVEVVTFVGGG
jgi:thiamine biosynthesis protein ThiS